MFIQRTGSQFKMTNEQFKKPTSSESGNDVAGSHLASSTGRGGACARECGAGCRAGTDGTAQTAALLRWDSTTGSYPSFPRQVTRHSLKLWEEAVKIMESWDEYEQNEQNEQKQLASTISKMTK